MCTEKIEFLILHGLPVDDAHRVEVTERQGQLRQVELDVFLREHHLLGEAREEVAAAEEVQNQVELALGLENLYTLLYMFAQTYMNNCRY